MELVFPDEASHKTKRVSFNTGTMGVKEHPFHGGIGAGYSKELLH